MGLFQLWVAVGDEYHFQRVVNGLTADVYRSETGWAFIVREGANLIEQGRTSTWDEAVERAQTAAEASKVMSAVHNEYMQTYQDEQAALSSSW